jgi:hypothetical protein
MSVVRVRAGEPTHSGCKNFTTSYSRFIFQRRQQHIRLAGNVNPGEVDYDLLYEELEISLCRNPVIAQEQLLNHGLEFSEGFLSEQVERYGTVRFNLVQFVLDNEKLTLKFSDSLGNYFLPQKGSSYQT